MQYILESLNIALFDSLITSVHVQHTRVGPDVCLEFRGAFPPQNKEKRHHLNRDLRKNVAFLALPCLAFRLESGGKTHPKTNRILEAPAGSTYRVATASFGVWKM
jgi:hypothetical protein